MVDKDDTQRTTDSIQAKMRGGGLVLLHRAGSAGIVFTLWSNIIKVLFLKTLSACLQKI